MLDKLTGKPVHYSIHFIALLAIAVGLPWSKIPLSLGTMLIVANLLLKADFKSYWQAWKQNPWLKVFLIYVIIEWISLIWTANWDYALNDMRRKLTLYSIPLAMVAFPLKSRKELFILALAFLSVLVITSFLNFGSYFHWWGNKSYVDIRSMSMFGSHIRFSMEIVMGIVICLAWILRRLPYFGIAFGIILWFVVYTYFSQVLTGYVSLAIVLLVSLLLILKNLSSKTVRVSILVGFTLLVLGSCTWIYDQLKPIEHKIELSSINAYSKNGEFYYLDRNTPWENGYPVLAQLARKELEQEWNKVSKIPYKDGKDIKGNRIQFTLMTYMTSRGLTKDKEGFKQLSIKEIRQIEMGTNSILIAKGGLKARLHGIRMQMEYSEDPNGHSLLQRFEYWKAAKQIISENWLLGVGLGDIDDAFKDYYKKSHSKLTAENQHRSHNQFITTWITSGILGFIAFAFWWGFQLKSAWNIKAFEWLCFASIAFVSFLTEDTIETQLGITFISFFFGIFISNHKLLIRDASLLVRDASRTNNL